MRMNGPGVKWQTGGASTSPQLTGRALGCTFTLHSPELKSLK
jgi:hypothetical protein